MLNTEHFLLLPLLIWKKLWKTNHTESNLMCYENIHDFYFYTFDTVYGSFYTCNTLDKEICIRNKVKKLFFFLSCRFSLYSFCSHFVLYHKSECNPSSISFNKRLTIKSKCNSFFQQNSGKEQIMSNFIVKH